ncbi:hypothetical protein HCBG_03315 [Histoplasma capsulatum G186AR]|uniref:Uncharacterized protein n=2 Tax=Ajellomyces capsulatus TaxID=5037 RepID=C0NJI5_AJECG|nr:uncharacterized protein HCBG_03315 [Histoplasma capsulatum G186AR]EEH08026.1 hypothetical protein HCBG_03315 [Histoplasma capsulatum G186AR]KAG5299647.1 hypothetical protein I7I52_10026 [Histoplasma capsulatum]QSS67727.1 hypothetical protein I7I50_06900 [Histoplasma capsulatum G186AR]
MQFKLFSMLALATFVVADEAVEKKRDIGDDLEGIASSIKGSFNNLITAIGNIPPNVASVLATAVPPPTGTNIQSYINSIVSDVNDGTPPAWYTSLPADAKSFLSSKASELATVIPTAAPTAVSTQTTSGNYAPAARPTGAIMGSLVGAAGVLGLAVML